MSYMNVVVIGIFMTHDIADLPDTDPGSKGHPEIPG